MASRRRAPYVKRNDPEPRVPRVLRRTTKIALEVVAAIFTGLVVLSALVFWRASTQPIQLEFLKDRVAAALSPADLGTATIGELRMEWRR